LDNGTFLSYTNHYNNSMDGSLTLETPSSFTFIFAIIYSFIILSHETHFA